MNKKVWLIVILALFILVGGVFWYLRGSFSQNYKEESVDSGGFFSNLFPDIGPSADEDNVPPAEDLGKTPTTSPEAANGALLQLVPESVGGATFIKNPSTSPGRVRYVEQATGHVYDVNPDGTAKTRISNTTVPGVFEVMWAPDGNRAIITYLTSTGLNILSAKFTASTTQGVFLPSDVKEALFSPKGDRIAYITESPNGGSVVTASPENKNPRAVFRSPFSSWTLLWPEEGAMYLTTRPSALLSGFTYRLGTASGAFEKIAGPRPGLLFGTDGKNALLSEADSLERTIHSSKIDLKTLAVTTLDAKLIPEKCAWSKKEKSTVFCALSDPFPQSAMPDGWYQGKLLFTDIAAKIDLASMSAQKIALGLPIDAYKPFLSAEEDMFFFINRYDGSLWALRLK